MTSLPDELREGGTPKQIRIERLTRAHSREGFTCGKPSLDSYLQRLALQHDERRIGRTFVAIEEGSDNRVLSYSTLATGQVTFENLPHDKKLPPCVPVPIILLGRLAVDSCQKGNGLSRRFLLHALWRSQKIATQAGVYAVEVDAPHEKAARFYAHYGFVALLDSPLHLYLPMKTIEAIGLNFAEKSNASTG